MFTTPRGKSLKPANDKPIQVRLQYLKPVSSYANVRKLVSLGEALDIYHLPPIYTDT